jgi:hypothetical protein
MVGTSSHHLKSNCLGGTVDKKGQQRVQMPGVRDCHARITGIREIIEYYIVSKFNFTTYRIFRRTSRHFLPQKQLMCTACYTKEHFIYEICQAEVEKFVKIKN